MTESEAIKDNCDRKCTTCRNTELPNIKDCREIDIGYSYAYKTDCAGDRYIKAEEVKYLLKCERNKAIDDFLKFASDMPTVEEEDGTIRPMWLEEMAEKLKAGGENEC